MPRLDMAAIGKIDPIIRANYYLHPLDISEIIYEKTGIEYSETSTRIRRKELIRDGYIEPTRELSKMTLAELFILDIGDRVIERYIDHSPGEILERLETELGSELKNVSWGKGTYTETKIREIMPKIRKGKAKRRIQNLTNDQTKIIEIYVVELKNMGIYVREYMDEAYRISSELDVPEIGEAKTPGKRGKKPNTEARIEIEKHAGLPAKEIHDKTDGKYSLSLIYTVLNEQKKKGDKDTLVDDWTNLKSEGYSFKIEEVKRDILETKSSGGRGRKAIEAREIIEKHSDQKPRYILKELAKLGIKCSYMTVYRTLKELRGEERESTSVDDGTKLIQAESKMESAAGTTLSASLTSRGAALRPVNEVGEAATADRRMTGETTSEVQERRRTGGPSYKQRNAPSSGLARTMRETKTIMDSSHVLTVENLQTAIQNSIGEKKINDDEAKRMAEHMLNFFGYSDRIIDNVLEPEDRDVFYMMEDSGLLTTESEETTLYDGREWRIKYWLFKKDKILELNEEDSGQKKVEKMKEPTIYDEIDELEWSTLMKERNNGMSQKGGSKFEGQQDIAVGSEV